METPDVTVVIETPKESRLKLKFDRATGLYKVDRFLSKGLRFPFNFGFIPGTEAADGDPTDVLLVTDEFLFPGCLVDCRILGVIRAEQTERGDTYRNDRILAVSIKDSDAPLSLHQLDRNFIANVARFFRIYHEAEGNRFTTLGTGDPEEALELIKRTTVRTKVLTGSGG